jgi:hypothetical protein
MPIVKTPSKIDAKAVRAQVADWTARLKSLYSQFDDWVQEHPGATVSRGEIKQSIEPLMKQFHVAPRQIPTYTVVVDEKWRIAFVPSAVWIVGANGRIDITTNIRHHMLFDVGGRNGAPSDWQLGVTGSRKFVIPFDKTAFLNLLGERR